MFKNILNLIFPPQCLNCRIIVPTHGTLCLNCWKNIGFISDPLCDCCGTPFEFEIGEGALCGGCIADRPPYGRARAAFAYNDHSHRLITRLKFSDGTHLAEIYAGWLAKAGAGLIAEADLLVPVPLHYFRFLRRRYNQSAILAAALAKKTGKKHLPDALKRTRNTHAQSGLKQSEREKNVKGAFSVNPRHKDKIKGKNILLIDDVTTTGSTAKQCTKILLKAGAKEVNLLTVAKSVKN